MCADSRASKGDHAFDVAKIVRVRGGLLGGAGAGDQILAFVDWFRRGCIGDPPNMSDCEMLYLSPAGKILIYDYSALAEEVKAPYHAIGSGAQGALCLMSEGYAPSQAIAVVRKVDPNTGGRIHTRKL